MAANTRFSTGVHALVLLAMEPARLQTSEVIAARLGTNSVVIRRVFSLLQQAELVTSQKGPSGGSRLTRSAKEITLKDIYKALESTSLFHDAARSAASPDLVSRELARVYKAAEGEMLASLDETTLHAVVKRISKKTHQPS